MKQVCTPYGFLVVFYMFLPLGESHRSSLNLVIAFVCVYLVFK